MVCSSASLKAQAVGNIQNRTSRLSHFSIFKLPPIFQFPVSSLFYSQVRHSIAFVYNMNVQLNYPVTDRDTLEFDEGGRASWYTIQNGPQIPNEEAPTIQTFNVSDWFNEIHQMEGAAPGSHRLLIIKNRTEHPHLRFPMNKNDFEEMLGVQGFPCLNELSLAIHAGGHAVFEAEANGRRSMT
jgi:hypothetical protein